MVLTCQRSVQSRKQRLYGHPAALLTVEPGDVQYRWATWMINSAGNQVQALPTQCLSETLQAHMGIMRHWCSGCCKKLRCIA
jgi:hypothetical protein